MRNATLSTNAFRLRACELATCSPTLCNIWPHAGASNVYLCNHGGASEQRCHLGDRLKCRFPLGRSEVLHV